MEPSELVEHAEEPEILKRCYKCEHQLLENLNIIYNASTSIIITWNRFQIFVYEDLNFENTAKEFLPEFQVRQIIISNNYLICLDTSGNIHTTCMKFKNPAQKRFKSSFQPREQSILCCIQIGDNILSLKHESNLYILCQNKVNSEFSLEKKAVLTNNGEWPLPSPNAEKCILSSHKIIGNEFENIKTLFGINVISTDCSLVLITFDKFTVYGCLFSTKMNEEDIKLVKMYTCPSEICNFEIIILNDLHILIGLYIGTLIKLSLTNIKNEPELIHLNTALHKFQTMKNTVIYSDGKSMWKTDDTFSETISFYQFFVRHVKDFIKFGDQIICTTFTDLIYIFPIDDNLSFVKPEITGEYCPAEKLLNNSEYLHKIIEELDNNNEVVKKINEEGNFITAFSLSNRQDIMDNIVQQSILVYESYEDVKSDNMEVLLTEKISQYFDSNAFLVLVKLSTTTLQHMFNSILKSLFKDVKIHISLLSEDKLLKTTSVKLTEEFKKINILIPININGEDLSEINVNIEIICSIPGAFDEKQKLWIMLYRKRVTLNAEHFIKTIAKKNNITNESTDDLVLNVVMAQFGGIYKFTDTAKYKLLPEFSVYLKLPQNYKELFKKDPNALSYLNKKKIDQIMKCYTSNDFLNSNNSISFDIGNKTVRVQILSDEFTTPLLKLSCDNMVLAHHVKNFFSKIIYGDYCNYRPGMEFVKYMLYNRTENLQKEINNCVVNQIEFPEFQCHSENFERNVIGALPL